MVQHTHCVCVIVLWNLQWIMEQGNGATPTHTYSLNDFIAISLWFNLCSTGATYYLCYYKFLIHSTWQECISWWYNICSTFLPWHSVLQSFFPAMTKIVGTPGPKSGSVEILEACLKAGMSGNCCIINMILDFWPLWNGSNVSFPYYRGGIHHQLCDERTTFLC